MTVYRHFTGVVYSAVVKAMAEEKGAYWLIDAIASHVVANKKFKTACKQDERFRDMQVWILKKLDSNCENMASLTAVADSGEKPKIKQLIPFTDFPFDENGEFKLFCGLTQVGERITYHIFEPSEY